MHAGILPLLPCNTNSKDYEKLEPLAIGWFVSVIATDVIITAVMVWYLRSARTGIRRTDQLITKICRGVLETGLATTTIVILDAIFFTRMVTTLRDHVSL